MLSTDWGRFRARVSAPRPDALKRSMKFTSERVDWDVPRHGEDRDVLEVDVPTASALERHILVRRVYFCSHSRGDHLEEPVHRDVRDRGM